MKHLILLSLLFTRLASAQLWSDFLDNSRAVDWTVAGTTIPAYSTNCSTQPSLTASSTAAAAANATSLTAALASCDATHNVVNIPSGTYYIGGWKYQDTAAHGKQVIRGAGPTLTTVYIASTITCNGFGFGVCMGKDSGSYWNNSSTYPSAAGKGSNTCDWTAGYTKDAASLTLGNCGTNGPPAVGSKLMLDQLNDSTDTTGVFVCDTRTAGCSADVPSGSGGNEDGRSAESLTRSQIQSTRVTAVTSLGGGSYTVTISPGVYFSNIRSGKSPGAWWTGDLVNLGLENLTIDYSYQPSGSYLDNPIAMFNCDSCWVKNVRTSQGPRSHIAVYESINCVIRDNYFFSGQSLGTSQSYGVEVDHGTSMLLLENNIFHQLTTPIMFGTGSGNVIAFNYTPDQIQPGANMQGSFYNHNAGGSMNLWEGNFMPAILMDSTTFGTSNNGTLYRNMLPGWQTGKTTYTYSIALETRSRIFNSVGNVLGQPSYHTHYESYAVGTTSAGGVNPGDAANQSIYTLGWTGWNGTGGCDTLICDALARSTMMRWGNYDVVTAGVKWDATEASPAAVTYANANFTSGYFGSLAHTLPASLHYSATPSWWPSGKAWPPVGPDVTSGNLGTCSGTYSGSQATTAGQCTGGTKTTQWGGFANSIPAVDCFFSLGGVPDGTGSALTSFDGSTCYTASSSSSGGSTQGGNGKHGGQTKH